MIIPEEYLQYLLPMGWKHINLTGDYIWNFKSVSSLDNLHALRIKKGWSMMAESILIQSFQDLL
jgi:hypothetical protein